MENVLFETLISVLATLLVTLIGVFGSWLTAKIAEKTKLQSLATATDEVIKMAQTTVLELQQTVVEAWKNANEDGKLTNDEVDMLGVMLLEKTKEKVANTTMSLLDKAGVDVAAIIKGAGEAFINSLRAK